MAWTALRLAASEAREHKAIYAIVVLVVGLTMAGFLLFNAYNAYELHVIDSDIQQTVMSDAVVVAPGTTVRNVFGEQRTLPHATELARQIEERVPGTKTAVRATLDATYNAGKGYDAAIIEGIDPQRDQAVANVEGKIVQGSYLRPGMNFTRGHAPYSAHGSFGNATYGYSGESPNDPPYPIIIGEETQHLYNLSVGDTFPIVFPLSQRGTDVGQVTVKVVGIYRTGFPELGNLVWFMDIDSVREIKSYGNQTAQPSPGGFQSFQVDHRMGDEVLVNYTRSPGLLQGKVGQARWLGGALRHAEPGYTTYTWHDLVRYLLGSMLDTGMLLVWGSMAVTLLLAGFAVKYVLDSTVLRKTREIGALKAFGASDGLVLRAYLLQGGAVGFLAGAVGLVLAAVGMAVLNRFGDAWGLVGLTGLHLGFAVTPGSLAVTLGLPTLMGLAAAVVPARRAARLAPVEALRRGELAA